MTGFEHAMLGGTLALALGARRRHGWPIVVTAGIAAALPDWDGLSLAFGPTAYSSVHRVWGHNLLAAVVGGVLVGWLGYLCHRSVRLQRRAALLLHQLGEPATVAQPLTQPPFSTHSLAVWVTVGGLAGLSHLPADLISGGSSGTSDWPVPLLWPFSAHGYSYPLLPWGDLGATLIFVAEMFALYRWRTRPQLIACLTLLAVGAYLLARAALVVLT